MTRRCMILLRSDWYFSLFLLNKRHTSYSARTKPYYREQVLGHPENNLFEIKLIIDLFIIALLTNGLSIKQIFNCSVILRSEFIVQ